MKKAYYTNCEVVGDNILYRGIDEDGCRVSKKIHYKPSLFLLDSTSHQSKYSTIDGRKASRMQFNSIREAREFVKSYSEVENFEIYGNTQFQYAYIADITPEDVVEWDVDDLVIAHMDIETSSLNGFPIHTNPIEQVTAITYRVIHKKLITTHVFGFKNLTNKIPGNIYHKSADEQSMLRDFISVWSSSYPDVITGWNINGFDIPYLVSRMDFILGDRESKKLSPWGRVNRRNVYFAMREREVFELCGISILDYLDLYKKYAPNRNRESYKLDFIARAEIGEGKVEYDGSLDELFKEDYQTYIEYNIQDVALTHKLDDELKLIELAIGLAYDTKTNYEDAFSQMRMWETNIFNWLKKRHQVIPQKKRSERGDYPGGKVKQPLMGMKKWIVSMDATSLYPFLQNWANISPETLRLDKFKPGVTVDGLLHKKINTDFLKDENITMAANGHCYSKEKQGFLPEILMSMYKDRKIFKEKMIENKKLLEEIDLELKRRKSQ